MPLTGATATEVAAAVGVSRQSVHTWIARYLVDGMAGLADRSRRPASCPHQVGTTVEVQVAEMRREHPRWGAKRIRMELLRKPVVDAVVPSTATINRILTRKGLVLHRPRKRPRDSYIRWERPAPRQLWGMDIVGGVMLVNPLTGELREAKVVTAVDDQFPVLREREGGALCHEPGGVPGVRGGPGPVRGARGGAHRQR